MMKAKALLILASVAMLLGGCDLLNCTEADVRCLQIDIYDSEENAASLLDTLTVKACGTDSILVNKSLDTKEILLPLSFHAPVDTFILQNYGKDYALEDTLFVTKSNDIFFESPDCPTVMMHTISSIRCTNVFVDSVSLVNRKVNFTETTHIRLFTGQTADTEE